MANNSLINVFKVRDLRKRIIFTIFLLIIFRIGTIIPVPGIDRNEIINYFNEQSKGAGGIIDFLDFFSGGALKRFSILMLGIMPYITTSIIMNLLTMVFPKLKKISQEDGGRKKIQRYTRFATIPVCLVQSFVITKLVDQIQNAITIPPIPFSIIAMLTVTTGTIFLMWMGEQITQRGIGNGISIIIFAGIVARMPWAVQRMAQVVRDPTSDLNPVFIIIVLVIFIGVVSLVIYEQQGQRKIPVHYAKRVIGRKIYGAQNTYLPFKINPSGVIPVIFASAVLTFPIQIARSLGQSIGWLQSVSSFLSPSGAAYQAIYAILIIFFAYFYTQVSMNPAEIAKNIRENGGSIPGIRSEKMEEYLTRILNRIVLPGAIFLAFIALIPSIIVSLFRIPQDVAYLLGGTSLLIIVGVDLDTMSQIEGHLKMHHRGGIMKKGKMKSRYL